MVHKTIDAINNRIDGLENKLMGLQQASVDTSSSGSDCTPTVQRKRKSPLGIQVATVSYNI